MCGSEGAKGARRRGAIFPGAGEGLAWPNRYATLAKAVRMRSMNLEVFGSFVKTCRMLKTSGDVAVQGLGLSLVPLKASTKPQICHRPTAERQRFAQKIVGTARFFFYKAEDM